MDSSIGGRFDYSLLDSLEWSEESYPLSSFLDEFGSSLPHVVKVLQGFCGDACSGTIDSGQILVLHSLHEETKILAKNAAQETELLIPKNFQVKVEMIPKNSLQESTSVRELLQTFPKYFRALSDIPSHGITPGSMFKIIRQKGYGCFECLEIINDGEEREVRLPFSLKGRFQALQDNREFLIDEVYAEEKDNLEADEPVNIHFVKSCSSGISVLGLNVESLYDLGTVRLVGECETQTVFATLLSSEDAKTLTVFPKDLEITVHSAKTNVHYDSVRCTVKKTQIKTLKRIERLNKLSLYQAKNPVRQFPQNELEPPPLPIGKTRAKSETPASIDSNTADKKVKGLSSCCYDILKPLERR